MDDLTEKRFGYLRGLSTDEKLEMIKELEEENEYLEDAIKDKRRSSEQISEFYSDITFNNERLSYLKSIMDEKHM